MKAIIELHEDSFERTCVELAERVRDDGYPVTVVVGIRTGGAVVAQRVADVLGRARGSLRYMAVSCRRPTTKWKRRMGLKRLLRHMPRWLVDMLRRMESWFVGVRTPPGVRGTVGWERAEDIAYLERLKDGAVLVVDDAVDSGVTLRTVVNSLRSINGEIAIRTAVIVVTQKRTVHVPDYALYHDALVRFPWSLDAAS